MALFQVDMRNVEEKKPMVWGAPQGIYKARINRLALVHVEGNQGEGWDQIECDLALQTPFYDRMIRLKFSLEKRLGYFYNFLKMVGVPENTFKNRIFEVPDNLIGKACYLDWTPRPIDPDTGKVQSGTYDSAIFLTVAQFEGALKSGQAVNPGSTPVAQTSHVAKVDLDEAPAPVQQRQAPPAQPVQQRQVQQAQPPQPPQRQAVQDDDDIPF